MKDLAPEIVRQRLLIEGYYSTEVDKGAVERYLLELPKHLNLRTYGEPIVFAPESGMGKGENAGFDGFIPLIDSGISLYVWSAACFFSAVLYTCKYFDEKAATDFTREYFKVEGELATMNF